ncbi:hypothetical protein VTK73DRAFT_8908 [Phialemonium thermophilum]|uniref:Methyltransferase domain-containing protein n=1 Tax=Phialemonium thermophilum TaxID=223376 RepID=A0ABR3W5U5_9PEZI
MARSLKPGGWIELQELNATPRCDDQTMGPDDAVKRVYDLVAEAFAHFGMDVSLPTVLGPMLRGAGFDNVHCVVKKVPIGAWALDPALRVIGHYQRLAVQDFLPALAGRPFEALGMSRTESEVTLALARNALKDMRVHRYFCYYFWYAQKPVNSNMT